MPAGPIFWGDRPALSGPNPKEDVVLVTFTLPKTPVRDRPRLPVTEEKLRHTAGRVLP